MNNEIKLILKHMSRYNSMLLRCYDPTVKSYKAYGAKGVTVCSEWLASFDAYMNWCNSNGYKEGLVLDKDILCDIKNISPKVYSPDTCQFITKEENMEYALKTTLRKAVACYDSEGNLLKVFGSISEAGSEFDASCVSRAVRGKRKTTNNTYWRYIKDIESAPLTIALPTVKRNGKPIAEVSLDGTIIEIFQNSKHASEVTGLNSRSISQVVNGDRNSIFGRIFIPYP